MSTSGQMVLQCMKVFLECHKVELPIHTILNGAPISLRSAQTALKASLSCPDNVIRRLLQTDEKPSENPSWILFASSWWSARGMNSKTLNHLILNISSLAAAPHYRCMAAPLALFEGVRATCASLAVITRLPWPMISDIWRGSLGLLTE